LNEIIMIAPLSLFLNFRALLDNLTPMERN
jgi:hypothetical protein